jgi:apolipoprotein D and lipocalin family protein
VVGHPGRDYLWILARKPTMDPATYQGILDRLKAQGYELDRLQRTLQRSGGSTGMLGTHPA